MADQFQYLKAVVFDWAGTMIDHGCIAPAFVFREIFKQRGIEITTSQAREPMGMAKRAHIATIAAMPEVAAAWQGKYGRTCSEDDVDAMYADFLPMQKQVLKDHCQLIPGAAEIAKFCRDSGLKIGSSTGYTRELMEVVTAEAAKQGYEPDCVLCSEDAPKGRPAPYLLHEAAKRMDVYPMWHIVKVDDTPVGIEAGRNAGCWTVGITQTGNGVGLSQDQFDQLPSDEAQLVCEKAALSLRKTEAHYIIETVADLAPVFREIDSLIGKGRTAIP